MRDGWLGSNSEKFGSSPYTLCHSKLPLCLCSTPTSFASLSQLFLHEMQVGKLHFGYILGWTVVGSVLIWFVLQSIVGSDHPEAKSLDLYTCCCLLGYSLLPIIGHAVVALLLPR